MKKKSKPKLYDQPLVECMPNYQPDRNTAPLSPRNDRQKSLINAIKQVPLTFAVGPAGTGKTFICGTMAADDLQAKTVKRIVITRPMVDADEDIGHLPGTAEEKFAPFFAPFREVLDERLGKSHVDNLIKMGRVEIAPLAFMRGRTFKNAFVVLDEAQNTTPKQMKLFLTRLGEGVTVVVNGDLEQKDIPGMSGLQDALNRLSGLSSVRVVEFESQDVVRSKLTKMIVEAYDQ